MSCSWACSLFLVKNLIKIQFKTQLPSAELSELDLVSLCLLSQFYFNSNCAQSQPDHLYVVFTLNSRNVQIKQKLELSQRVKDYKIGRGGEEEQKNVNQFNKLKTVFFLHFSPYCAILLFCFILIARARSLTLLVLYSLIEIETESKFNCEKIRWLFNCIVAVRTRASLTAILLFFFFRFLPAYLTEFSDGVRARAIEMENKCFPQYNKKEERFGIRWVKWNSFFLFWFSKWKSTLNFSTFHDEFLNFSYRTHALASLVLGSRTKRALYKSVGVKKRGARPTWKTAHNLLLHAWNNARERCVLTVSVN